MQPSFTHREPPHRIHLVSGLIALACLAAVLLAGCSGGTGTRVAESARGGAPAKDSAGAGASSPGAPLAPGASAGTSEVSKTGVPVPGGSPRLTKSASISVQVKHIDAAAAQVRTLAAGLQAQVISEQIGAGGPGEPGRLPLPGTSGAGTGFGTLTLSVPADKLDIALDQLAHKLGIVLQRSLSTQDVTAQYIDTASRLTTMRASVGRVRALMVQARDLGQVVALESELSRRQADLESLESQLAALDNSVARSTVSVSLSTPGTEPVTRDSGFGAGLRSGWDAFAASARGLFTAVGAVLPFAVFFALVTAPIVWWLRRRTQVGAAAEVTP